MTLTFGLKVKVWDHFSLEWVLPLFSEQYEGDLVQRWQEASQTFGTWPNYGWPLFDLHNLLFGGQGNQTPELEGEIGFYMPETLQQ